MDLNVRKLQSGDEKAFIEAYQEFKVSQDFDFVSHYKEGMDFSDLIHRLDEIEQGRNLPQNYVPSTFLFGFVGPKLIGRVMIRHELNDFLRRIGGHIGYGVVPSERGKGYASQMLEHAIVVAQSMGLEKVLITCDEDNLPSRKIIENSGGVFVGLSDQGVMLPPKRLYWIQLRG
jgi:predicted acetyltransferase